MKEVQAEYKNGTNRSMKPAAKKKTVKKESFELVCTVSLVIYLFSDRTLQISLTKTSVIQMSHCV